MWMDARSSNAFLNIVQHVRDNRRGPVHHDAVASATGMLAGFHFERPKDTSVSSMKAITKKQFVPAQGGTHLRNLNWLHGKGDRAYTIKEAVYDFFIPSGARLRGTKKRSKDWPQSYGLELKDGDGRTDIPVTGAKTMLVKSVDVQGRKLYACAYRNGNGGVTLGATTEPDDVYHWDVTLKNPADRQWFFELSEEKIPPLDYFRRAFRPFDATRKTQDISEELVELLRSQPMHPVTMGQSNDHAWWICRMFAFSSTGSDRGFALFDGTEDELTYQKSWSIAKQYLGKSGLRSWSLAKQEELKEDVVPNATEEAKTEEEEDEDDVIETVDLNRLLEDDDYASLMADSLDSAIEEEEEHVFVLETAIRQALEAGGASLSKANTEARRSDADRKKFIEWCRQHGLLRRHFLKKNAVALKQIARSLSPPCPIESDVTVPGRIYDAIKNFLQQHPEAQLEQSGNLEPVRAADLSKGHRLLHAVLSAAFLKKLKGDQRDDTRRGLDLEKPLARRLIEDSKSGYTAGFSVEEIASAPLVERTGVEHRSAVGSTDFVASVKAPGSSKFELAAIEVKGRVREGTAQKEQASQGLARLRVLSKNGLVDRNQKYFAIAAEDDVFSYFVTSRSEAVQILHHAYIYDVEWVLLLIGDTYGRIIAGIWVSFDRVLKAAWGDVLSDLYRLSVAFLYEEPNAPFRMSDDQCQTIEPVLQLITVAGGKLDLHSFRQMVMIWRVIRLLWPKPLPPFSKLLPYIFSSWNSAKGGSDTITKLIWSVKYEPPNRLPQAHAIARMLVLVDIAVHRAHQISTSKLSLPYKSLLHYRNAANKRFSLHKSVLAISRSFDDVIFGGASTNTPVDDVPAAVVSPSNSPPKAEVVGRALRGSKPKLHVQAPAFPITGSTPKRSVRSKLDGLLDGSIKPKKNESLVADRVRQCTGIPVYGAAYGTCCICGCETHWFCLGCHVHVCMNNSSKAKKVDFDYHELDVTIPALSGSGANEKKCKSIANKCFFHYHRVAIFESLGINITP